MKTINAVPKISEHHRAFIITGPTSGIGLATALELSGHGTVILVGRDRRKLAEVQRTIQQKGRHAVSVVCDLSDMESVQRAVREITALPLYITGLLNNAGILQMGSSSKNAQGWDLTFATNHLGPFALTEELVPHLPDGANVLFVASAVEDPGRRPAVAAGFRGSRYISAEASAHGEFQPDGSRRPGFDAYATSKQANLAAAMALARETPRLHFNAVEPGLNLTTGLGHAAGPLRALQALVFPLLTLVLMPFIKILSTPRRAALVITNILTDTSGRTGIYYDEKGSPMQGSAQVRDPDFQDRVVAETRKFLRTTSMKE